jgi:protein-ribulosamine 3-kinase
MVSLLQHVSEILGSDGELRFQSVGGGCINKTGIVTDKQGNRHFLKVHHTNRLPNFEAEAAGLQEIANTETIRAPRPIQAGTDSENAFLIMEALDLHSPKDRDRSERQLAKELAALHRTTGDAFGWNRDNVIGDTPQRNTWESSWVTFFREHRLRYQIELAARRGLDLPGATQLLDQLNQFFQSYRPAPSLLHGDLWSGNVGYDKNSNPVIFDPAVYFGDRETDIAFTEMFGGIGAEFYQSYHEAYPLDDGYSTRRPLYNLYHVLNHYNLFGGHYACQANEIISSLLQ